MLAARRVEKVLNAHLLTKLSRTAYTEVAETSGSDKWEWEREKVSKLLSEHLRFRKKFKKTTENEAIDTNQTDKQKVADMLSEHLRVKIQMKHVSPSSSSPGSGASVRVLCCDTLGTDAACFAVSGEVGEADCSGEDLGASARENAEGADWPGREQEDGQEARC